MDYSSVATDLDSPKRGRRKYSDVKTAFDGVESGSSSTAKPSEGVPTKQRLAKGMLQSHFGLLGLANTGARAVLPESAEKAIGLEDPAVLAAAPEKFEREWFGNVAPPAKGFGEALTEGVGGIAAPAGLPLQVAFGVPKAVGGLAIEGIGALGSAVGGATARANDWGPAAEVGLSMLGGLAPGLAARQMARSGTRTAAKTAAQEAAERWGGSVGGDASRKRLAAAMEQASSEIKAMLPEGYDDAASARLGQAVTDFPDAATTPLTSQVLDELGGEQFESTTKALTRGDRTFGAQVAGQRLRAEESIDEGLEALRPAGGFDEATAGYEALATQLDDAERSAWKSVPKANLPTWSTDALKAEADRIAASVGKAGQGDIPSVFKTIADYDGTESLAELQALRSKLLRINRAGSSRFATEAASSQAAHASRLLPAIDREIDALEAAAKAGGGVPELRAAWAATRRNRELLDRGSDAVKALADPQNPGSIARAALKSPKEAAQVAKMFAGDETTLNAVKGLVVDQVIGPIDALKGGKTAIKAIRDNRPALVELFGAEHVGNMERLVRQSRIVRSGTAGTRQAAWTTGSNTLASGDALLPERFMEILGQRGGSLSSTVVLGSRALAQRAVAQLRNVPYPQVMAAALRDPAFAKALIDMPTTRAMPAWANSINAGLARNGLIRPAIQSAGGAE